MLTACALMQTLAALFSVDDITGFQITNLLELPEPYGIIFLWGFVFPAVFIFVASATNFIFKDNLILKVRPLLMQSPTECPVSVPVPVSVSVPVIPCEQGTSSSGSDAPISQTDLSCGVMPQTDSWSLSSLPWCMM